MFALIFCCLLVRGVIESCSKVVFCVRLTDGAGEASGSSSKVFDVLRLKEPNLKLWLLRACLPGDEKHVPFSSSSMAAGCCSNPDRDRDSDSSGRIMCCIGVRRPPAGCVGCVLRVCELFTVCVAVAGCWWRVRGEEHKSLFARCAPAPAGRSVAVLAGRAICAQRARIAAARCALA